MLELIPKFLPADLLVTVVVVPPVVVVVVTSPSFEDMKPKPASAPKYKRLAI
ncbi:hypothetical protein D3C87_2078810 [compost metagenome]